MPEQAKRPGKPVAAPFVLTLIQAYQEFPKPQIKDFRGSSVDSKIILKQKVKYIIKHFLFERLPDIFM